MAQNLFKSLRSTLKRSIAWSLIFALVTPQVSIAQVGHEDAVKAAPVKTFKTISNYCAPAKENAVAVRPELLQLEAKEEFKTYTEALKEVFDKLAQMREALLTEGSAQTRLAATLSETAAETEEIRLKAIQLIEKLPAIYRAQGQLVLTNYFKLAGTRIELEQMANPRQWGLDNLRFKYALELSSALMERYLAMGDLKIPGVDIDPIKKNGQLVYRMAINGETVFQSMVRSAARSPMLQQPKESYLETTRCILGRAVLGKLSLNKSMIGQNDVASVLNPNQPFCLGAKTEEFVTLAKRDTDMNRELAIRATFLKNIPEVSTKIASSSGREFFTNPSMVTQTALLAGFPGLIVAINTNLKQKDLPPIPEDQFIGQFRELDRLINAEYKKAPAWEDMRLVWRLPQIQDRLASLFDNCKVQLRLPNGQPTDIDQLWYNLMRSDDVGFLFSLYNDVASIPGNWSEMTPAQLTEVLRNYILAKKVQASIQAIAYLVDYSVDNNSAQGDDLMAAADADLRTALSEEFKKIWFAKPDLEKWLAELVTKITTQVPDVSSSKVLVHDYTTELVAQADKVAAIMDPKRSPGDLPYEEKHVLDALGSSVKLLSPENRRRYIILRDETDYAKRNEIWMKISSIMEQEAQSKGSTCKVDPSITDNFAMVLGNLVGYKPSVAKKTVNQDCLHFTMVAEAIGSNRRDKPKDLSYTILALQNRTAVKNVEEFVTNYRQRVASSKMAEHRLLDLPINENGETRLWQKLVRVRDPFQLEPDIIKGLRTSVASLEGYLKNVVGARSEQDLAFLIQRTKVINLILGENQIDINGKLNELNPMDSGDMVSSVLSNNDDGYGFMFPSLLRYHQKLQAKMNREEDFKTEMWSEFMSTNVSTLIGGVLVGWAAKFGLGMLPRRTGAQAVASLIDKTGYRISSVIGAHADFTMLFFTTDMIRLWNAKADANNELVRIGDLRTSEGASFSKNLDITPGGAFPLLSETDFYKQKVLFEQARDKASADFWETAGWLAVPFFLGHGIKMYSAVRSGIRGWRDLNYAKMGGIEKSLYLGMMRFGINGAKARLANDFYRLGNPPLEIGRLQAARDAQLLRAVNNTEKNLINEAYERIVVKFGRDIESYSGLPNLQQAYAVELLGPGASARQLVPIYKEYMRLTHGGLP